MPRKYLFLHHYPHHIYRALGAVLGPKYTLDPTGTPRYQGVFTKEAQKPFYKEDYTTPKPLLYKKAHKPA
ncbi:hypothetical protein [Helicobacter canis]|uniref:hypothetical protein n=1 Tax=Helicobacter canis TaxID=29419 RepID=UPI0011C04E6D|nr:hypothetical protein [Helicobacter canis]